MDTKVIIVLIMTFIVNFIAMLSYSARTAGINTGKMAVANSIFNVFNLGSRAAGAFQAPFLAKTVENAIGSNNTFNLLIIFRYILLSTALGSICGAIFIPTFQRILCKAIESFNTHRSIPKLMLHGFSKSGIVQFKRCIKIPSRQSIKQLKRFERMPKKIILFNIIATALVSTGSISSIYAGVLNTELRTTCTTLSSVVNGLAIILLYIFIDPNLSMMTDDVILGKRTESDFRRCTMFMVSGRILGTIAAQLLLVPAAILISRIASII